MFRLIFAISLIVPGLQAQVEPFATASFRMYRPPLLDPPHVWSNGFIPRYSTTEGSEAPEVWLVAKDGTEAIPRTSLFLSEASRPSIRAVAATPDGKLVFSAEILSTNGAREGIVGIVSATSKGTPMRIARTGEFVARDLTVSRDGSIWAFGVPIHLQPVDRTDENYDAVLRFRSDGELADAVAKRSAFGDSVVPTRYSNNAGMPHIVSSQRSLAAYSPFAERWIEWDLSGKLLGNIAVARLLSSAKQPMTLGRLFMTQNGEVIAMFDDRSGTDDVTYARLDRENAKWVRLPTPNIPASYGFLAGVEGEQLIFRSSPDSFGWFSLAVFGGRSPRDWLHEVSERTR